MEVIAVVALCVFIAERIAFFGFSIEERFGKIKKYENMLLDLQRMIASNATAYNEGLAKAQGLIEKGSQIIDKQNSVIVQLTQRLEENSKTKVLARDVQ